MFKTTFSTLVLMMAMTNSVACAAQETTKVRGPKMNTDRVTCGSIKLHFLAEEYPDGKHSLSVELIRHDGTAVIRSNLSDKVKSLIDIDKNVMKAKVKCNKESDLPLLILPKAKEGKKQTLTFDAAERVSLKTE